MCVGVNLGVDKSERAYVCMRAVRCGAVRACVRVYVCMYACMSGTVSQ